MLLRLFNSTINTVIGLCLRGQIDILITIKPNVMKKRMDKLDLILPVKQNS